jgi:cyclic beta-1,2-glucan synthetase
VQKQITLPPGQEAELIFTLGWGEHRESAIKLLAEYRTPEQVRAAIGETTDFWRQTLTAISVKTPNRALDTLVNHWLLYQTLSCRVWGRSAFYQAGGAYGYRDQLQDSMALVYSLPGESRRIILQAASRQFEAGDVQHWWHPPTGRGVRTRFADDYLWLPLVTSHYVTTTGDSSILNEVTSYLHSLALEPHEEERYELPEISSVKEDLYHHCLRAIDHSLRFGAHGLPLIGTGDWNDGLNKVGNQGRGESVWMGWFLRVVLQQFIPLVVGHGDAERANVYRREADRLLQAVEREAWDGKWYRRAYFDDGSPIGSSKSDECQIDSLTQSWAVQAGADPQRANQAMRSVEEHLIRTNDRLALLLEPPFDKSNPGPGYIQGYPPGIRENGGQYTHAATWLVQALAAQGRGTQAVKLFDLLNPILSSANESAVDRYRVEPYVVAADVYSNPQHVGRGGWTWYTGSAAWMYRVAVESILGLRLRGDRLTLVPCIPKAWDGYEIAIRRGRTTWRIRLRNEQPVDSKNVELLIDGLAMPAEGIQLVDDGREHIVEASLRSIATPEPAPVDADATNLVERRPRRAVPK